MPSVAERLSSLPPAEYQKVLTGLSDQEIELLPYDWSFWARESQLPPDSEWFVWLILSGRGFGKTRSGAEMVRKWAQDGHSPIALIGQTKADVRDTMVEVGESSILKISPPWFMPDHEPSKRRLTWPNGVEAIIYSGDEPDQLRGLGHAKAWLDELAKFRYPQKTWDTLLPGLRVGQNPQAIVTTTPRPIKLLKDFIRDKRVVVTRGHTQDNKTNLPPEFLNYILSKYEGTKLGRQELAGELLERLEGLVYDTFKPDNGIIPRFAIPNDWPRHTGHDFGLNNTACLWVAQEPATGFFYVYRTYKQGGGITDHVQNFKEESVGEVIRRKVGGNHQEQEIRDGYTLAGWSILEPHLRAREVQIKAVQDLHTANRIYVFSDVSDYIDEKTSFSWEVDKEDNYTGKIHNEAAFHLMAAERYLMSEFHVVLEQEKRPLPVNYG